MPDEHLDALATAAAAGDGTALEKLLVAIEPLCIARCTQLLPNRLDAEEAAQDAMLAVARGITRFEGRCRFSTWLYQVTSNAAFDTYRRLKRRASVLASQLDDRATLERTSVLAGTHVDLLEALEDVDPRFATPVVLRDVCGLDYAEIADLLEIPPGTVKSRIHEGRKTLQWLLER